MTAIAAILKPGMEGAAWTITSGLPLLPISPKHLHAVVKLPFPHREPFDRLIIAQANSEELSLVSGDTAFRACGMRLLWQ